MLHNQHVYLDIKRKVKTHLRTVRYSVHVYLTFRQPNLGLETIYSTLLLNIKILGDKY